MSSLRDWRVTRALFAALLLLTLASVAGAGTVVAQDASPEAAVCDSSGLPPGSPTAVEPEASPAAMEDMEMGTPEAMAVPPVPVLPEGQPADAGVTGAITAAIENYAACYNEGQSSGDPGLYVALETENYLLNQTGSTNPYDRVASELEDAPASAEVISIENPMSLDDGRVSADVHILLDDHWLIKNRYVLALADDMTWKIDEEYYLRPEPDTATVSVNGINITETTDEATGQITYAFVFTGSPTITQSDAVVINVSNMGAELHEAVVVQLPEGADPLGLLDGSVAFEDADFVGGVIPVWPGETRDIALLNLEPGTYTLLCFFPGPDGTPHAANGMIGTFEIVAPAA